MIAPKLRSGQPALRHRATTDRKVVRFDLTSVGSLSTDSCAGTVREAMPNGNNASQRGLSRQPSTTFQVGLEEEATVLAARVRNSSHCSGLQLCKY